MPSCWISVDMADFVKDMPQERQISLGFWGVEPSTKMVRIEWSIEGCQRLHGHLPSHWWLPQDPYAYYKFVTIADLFSEMSARSGQETRGPLTPGILLWLSKPGQREHVK